MDAVAKMEVEAETSDSPIPQVRNIGLSAWGLGFRERLERYRYIYIYIYIYPTFIQGKTARQLQPPRSRHASAALLAVALGPASSKVQKRLRV